MSRIVMQRIEMRKLLTKQGLSSFFFAILTTLAFFSGKTVAGADDAAEWLRLNYWNQINISNINFNLDNAVYINITRFQLNYADAYGILPSVFFVLLFLVYFRCVGCSEYTGRNKVISAVGALFYTAFTVIGRSFLAENSMQPLCGDAFQLFITGINAAGFWVFFYHIGRCLLFAADQYKISDTMPASGRISLLSVLKDMGILLVMWLPYLVVFYPGTMNVDSLHEINEFLSGNYHTHYPLFHTVLIGALFKAGQIAAGDNFGLFLCNICQVLSAAIVLSVCIHLICRMINVRKGLLAFFGFFPVFPIWCYTLVKDSAYSLCVMLMVVLLIAGIAGKIERKKKFSAIFFSDLILIVLLRNNGWALILFTAITIGLCKNIRKKKRLLAVCIAAVMAGSMLNAGMIRLWKASDAFNLDALSLPLQQTARYASEYTLTEEEYAAIDAIIDVEGLGNYEPEIADPVKSYGRGSVNRTDIIHYLKTYVSMFLKHPMPYFEAFFNMSYGYVYPDRTEYKDGIATYHINIWQDANTFNLELHPLEKTEFPRVVLETLAYAGRNLPLVGLLYSTGIYTWFLLGMLLLFLYIREFKAMVCLAPCAATILICMISPVDAYVRYMLPVMLCMPFYLVYMLYAANVANASDEVTLNVESDNHHSGL